eukprot:m.454056 g.454056  ORF g.454056 m.454056 type:complete len:127 (+) comp20606_c0_seq1:2987-3367(+)
MPRPRRLVDLKGFDPRATRLESSRPGRTGAAQATERIPPAPSTPTLELVSALPSSIRLNSVVDNWGEPRSDRYRFSQIPKPISSPPPSALALPFEPPKLEFVPEVVWPKTEKNRKNPKHIAPVVRF